MTPHKTDLTVTPGAPRATRGPTMLGIKNSRQPQLDCEHHSAACRGRSVTLVGAGGWWPDP